MATDDGFAPAKVNLALHITGRRSDGYHLLDSLVVFAAIGDRVTASPSDGLTLEVRGPEAHTMSADSDNLVLRAARLAGVTDVRLVLDKHLPVASGIGGGSADAAATLRVLARMTGRSVPAPDDMLALGADVPACLDSRPLRMRGIGEIIVPLGPLPPLWIVLANPRVSVATPDVFRALIRRDNPGMPDVLPICATPAALMAFLATCRNDLQAAAIDRAPAIATVLDVLSAQPACRLARMSGSGATCFALFDSAAASDAASAAIAAAYPRWWVRAAPILG